MALSSSPPDDASHFSLRPDHGSCAHRRGRSVAVGAGARFGQPHGATDVRNSAVRIGCGAVRHAAANGPAASRARVPTHGGDRDHRSSGQHDRCGVRDVSYDPSAGSGKRSGGETPDGVPPRPAPRPWQSELPELPPRRRLRRAASGRWSKTRVCRRTEPMRAVSWSADARLSPRLARRDARLLGSEQGRAHAQHLHRLSRSARSGVSGIEACFRSA